MKIYTRNRFIILICVAFLTVTLLTPITASAWGDSDGGRPSYTVEEINNGAIGATPASDGEDYKNSPDYPGQIIFNTISDSVIGDEKNFVGARQCIIRGDGRAEPADPEKKEWRGNNITVADGQYYIIRLYVHNNNPNGFDAVAEDTRVSFSIPDTSAATIEVNGFISSSNATPSKYWDYINFNSEDGTPFHLEYIQGTALLENNSIGLGGLTLSDDIVNAKSGGILIGYDALDGRIPGCYQYDNFASIKVKAVYDYEFSIETKVRLADDEDDIWQDTVDAKIGDKVEFQIQYKNTSNYTQKDVSMMDVLPSNLRYVDGSAKLYNVLYPNGATFTEGTLVTTGVKIGSYTAGSNAFIRFTAEVVNDSLACGANTLYNWGQATVGKTMIQDDAEVHAQEEKNRNIFIAVAPVLGIALLVCLVFIIILLYKMYHWKQTHK